MASSSESGPGDQDIIKTLGEESGWVEARTSCPHLEYHVIAHTQSLPRFDSPCKVCKDHRENWLCLGCSEVFCGRFINGHMLAHHRETGHPAALSYRDLSVWCFSCDSYLDAQVISELRRVFNAVHNMKFGAPAPARG